MRDEELWSRLAELVTFIEGLERAGSVPLADYNARVEVRWPVRHGVVVIVEAASDINAELYRRAHVRVPHGYYDTFRDLPSIGVLRASLANELASVAGLRNQIVHEYGRVDDHMLYDRVASVVKLFTDYVAAVRERLPAPSEEDA